jgi:virulence-associated protein VagC
MSETGIARLFKHGRSQAVRLPLAFRLPGDRVRVRRVDGGILLEPIVTDLDAWFAELACMSSGTTWREASVPGKMRSACACFWMVYPGRIGRPLADKTGHVKRWV